MKKCLERVKVGDIISYCIPIISYGVAGGTEVYPTRSIEKKVKSILHLWGYDAILFESGTSQDIDELWLAFKNKHFLNPKIIKYQKC